LTDITAFIYIYFSVVLFHLCEAAVVASIIS